MIKINSDNEILCPMCGGNLMHHSSVNVITRDSEDGPGTSTRSNDDGVFITRIEANEIFGRRGEIEIELWCETCGENAPKKKLAIKQHKGNTKIQWV